MSDHPMRVESTTIEWSCPWFQVRKDEIALTDAQKGVHIYIEKPPFVSILPVTRDGQIVLIRNYRHPAKEWCWEIPAGGQKPGQSLEEAARDELQEEVGGIADHWEYVLKVYVSPGLTNEVAHIYLATGVTLGSHHRDALEIMETHLFTVADALEMVRAGTITNAETALALLLCEPKLLSLRS